MFTDGAARVNARARAISAVSLAWLACAAGRPVEADLTR
jgi:hypothetical protein